MDEVNCLLLVEDNQADLDEIQTLLAKTGVKIHKLLIARDLGQARASVKGGVDVIILDLTLPPLSGIDTLNELKKFFDGVLVIFTEIDSDIFRLECLANGADSYLVKGKTNEGMLKSAILYAKVRKNIKNLNEKLNSV